MFFINAVSAIRVFKFESSSPEDLSFVTLDPDTPILLPDKFILCTSHQQTKMDERNFYEISGDDGKLWMTTRFDIGLANSVGLWGQFTRGFKYIGEIEKPKLFFWYNICHNVDTVTGKLSVAVNGQILNGNLLVESLKTIKPTYLGRNLVLGRSSNYQSNAVITNVKVFKEGNLSIEKLSSNLCSFEGDVLSWQNASWIETGPGVKLKDKDNLCSNSGSYELAIPIGVSQEQAVETCDKLGHGGLRLIHSQEEIQQFLEWFEKTNPGICSRFWTPYSDHIDEGLFTSLEDGSMADFLPWGPEQPNGLNVENGVDLRLVKDTNPSYYDSKEENEDCFCCSLSEHFSLSLRGLCQQSLIGREV